MHNDVIYVHSAVDSCYETAQNQYAKVQTFFP